MKLHPPPLPIHWPYAPRPLSGLAQKGPLEVPGFGSGWWFEGVDEPLDGIPEPLTGAFGRGGVTALGDRVIRPYRRGGWLRHVVRTVYATSHRFRDELFVHRALWGAGFPTVEPLGCAWRRRGLGVEGLYLTRRTAGQAWPRAWEIPGVMEALETALRSLVAWGVWSPDLNTTNVLVQTDGSIVLLDWDRARWVASSELLARYRARLLRSLEKQKAPLTLIQQVQGWR